MLDVLKMISGDFQSILKCRFTINSCLTADATANYIPDFPTVFHVFQYVRRPRFALEGQVSAREVRKSRVKLSSVGSGLVKRLLSYASHETEDCLVLNISVAAQMQRRLPRSSLQLGDWFRMPGCDMLPRHPSTFETSSCIGSSGEYSILGGSSQLVSGESRGVQAIYNQTNPT